MRCSSRKKSVMSACHVPHGTSVACAGQLQATLMVGPKRLYQLLVYHSLWMKSIIVMIDNDYDCTVREPAVMTSVHADHAWHHARVSCAQVHERRSTGEPAVASGPYNHCALDPFWVLVVVHSHYIHCTSQRSRKM